METWKSFPIEPILIGTFDKTINRSINSSLRSICIQMAFPCLEWFRIGQERLLQILSSVYVRFSHRIDKLHFQNELLIEWKKAKKM